MDPTNMDFYYRTRQNVGTGSGLSMADTEAITQMALEAALGRTAIGQLANNHQLQQNAVPTAHVPMLTDSSWLALDNELGLSSSTNNHHNHNGAANFDPTAAGVAARLGATVSTPTFMTAALSTNNLSGLMNSHSHIEDDGSPEAAGSPQPKKRRQPWGRQLTPPTTNLAPRKRAKTDAEKAQRAYERVIRNRKAAEISRQRKQAAQDKLAQDLRDAELQNENFQARLDSLQQECDRYKARVAFLETELSRCTGATATPITPPAKPAMTDNYVSPSALTCESPIEHFDEHLYQSGGPTSPATVLEDDNPKTPTEARPGHFSEMFSGFGMISDPTMLPQASDSKRPTGTEHFEEMFSAMDYARSLDSDQLNDLFSV